MKRFDVQHAARRFYGAHRQEILSAARNEWAIDAYAWDEAGIRLSPIEQALWCDIRDLDMVMYPQWTIAGYFVDFGNPVAKVAIECDGRAFHNPERDEQRQREIEAWGWTVYRFEGWECNKQSHKEKRDTEGRIRVEASDTFNRLRFIADMHGLRSCAAPIRVSRHYAETVIGEMERLMKRCSV